MEHIRPGQGGNKTRDLNLLRIRAIPTFSLKWRPGKGIVYPKAVLTANLVLKIRPVLNSAAKSTGA